MPTWLAVYFQSVVCCVYVWRQAQFQVTVQAGAITHVYEIRLLRRQCLREPDGVTDGLVATVRLVPEAVDDKCLYATQGVEALCGYGLHVCDIGHAAYAKADDGQSAVHDAQWQNLQLIDVENTPSYYCIEPDVRNARIAGFCKAVGHALADMRQCGVFSPKMNGPKTAEWAQVIESADVVVMLVGDEHGV